MTAIERKLVSKKVRLLTHWMLVDVKDGKAGYAIRSSTNAFNNLQSPRLRAAFIGVFRHLCRMFAW